MGGGRSTDHLLGTVIADRYTITDAIGHGAMGKVYRARHVFLHNDVAIKILHGHLCGHRQYLDRFLREARAAAGVEHENVMSVTDFGELPGGSAFFAMELLLGEDLSHLLEREGRLPWSRARNLVVQIVRGLAAVHAAGVVHRDVKPANCFLTDDGKRVKIIDFGIAKLDPVSFDPTRHRTLVGTVMGTPYYMSPEQALGETVDGRTDVYAVGVLLYRMLTGRVPFVGSAQAVRHQHIIAPVPSPSEAAGCTLPSAVEQLILRALAKELPARFENMAAFERAILDAWTAGETLVSGEASRVLSRSSKPDGGSVARTQIWEESPRPDEAGDSDEAAPASNPKTEGDPERVGASEPASRAVAATQILVVDKDKAKDSGSALPAVREPSGPVDVANTPTKTARRSGFVYVAAVAAAVAGLWLTIGRAGTDAPARAVESESAAHDSVVLGGEVSSFAPRDVATNAAGHASDAPMRLAEPADAMAPTQSGGKPTTGSDDLGASPPPDPSGVNIAEAGPVLSSTAGSVARDTTEVPETQPGKPLATKRPRSESKRTLSTPVIERMVAGVQSRLTECAAHTGGSSPLVRLRFTIPAAGGLVDDVRAVGEHAGTPLGQCVAGVVGDRLRFPASDRTQEFTARLRIR